MIFIIFILVKCCWNTLSVYFLKKNNYLRKNLYDWFIYSLNLERHIGQIL